MAVFDATALIHLLEPDAPSIIDPATKMPVPDTKAERSWYFVSAMRKAGAHRFGHPGGHDASRGRQLVPLVL